MKWKSKLFGQRHSFNFVKACLTETTDELRNPARGWYQIYPFYVEEKPDFSKLSWCGKNNDTLALIIINIGAYRERDLDEIAATHIQEIIQFFVGHHYDIILRVVYDHEGKAVEREPFFFYQVLAHLKQLVPILTEFSKDIFVYQGMLVGNWGEMHTSRFLTSDKLNALYDVLKNLVSSTTYLAVRKPVQWRSLHPEDCGRLELTRDHCGLFDDGIFGSESHLGTFGEERRETAGWESAWQTQDELEFEDCLCSHVPNGGEVVYNNEWMQTTNLKKTVPILKKMHISYLNRAYDERVLSLWKQWRPESGTLWSETSGFDYIGRHLGYRFVVREVGFTPIKQQRDLIQLAITVENVGFANLYQSVTLWLMRELKTGSERTRLACDLRTCAAGTTKIYYFSIKRAAGRCYLTAKRDSDHRVIYFANEMDTLGRVYLGEIKTSHDDR